MESTDHPSSRFVSIARACRDIDLLHGTPETSTLRIYDKHFNLLASTAGDTDSVFELNVSVDSPNGPRLTGRIESVIWNATQ